MTVTDPKVARLALAAIGIARGWNIESALDAAYAVDMPLGQPVPETDVLLGEYLTILGEVDD